MTNSNMLEPLVKGLISYGKWFISAWSDSNRFDFNNYFRTVKLCNKNEQYPRVIKTFEGTKGTVYLITVPVGLNEGDFKAHKESIKAQLKADMEIRLRNGFIELEVITKKLNKSNYSLPKRIKDTIVLPIGESLEGPISIDLKEFPHSFVVGTTGSGKSVCSKGILTSLVNNYGPNEVELYLCDLKMVELALFRNLKHTKKFVFTVEDTTEVIADLLEETKNRYNLFMEKGVTDIFEYNKLPGVKKLKYQVLFVEEAVILLEDKSKKAMKLLKQLMAISRACGCYCFITTQRPSSDIIDNVVKSLISNRIVFAVEDSKNSIICLDSEGAEKLEGKGHGILKVGPNKTEFQSYYITDEQVRQYTKHLIVKNSHLKAPRTVEKVKSDQQVAEQNEKAQNGENKLNDLSFLDIL